MLAGLSAGLSLLLLLWPALFVQAPLKQLTRLSHAGFQNLLTLILAVSAATIALAATYNFRLTTIDHIYDYRDALQFPTAIRYLVGWVRVSAIPGH